MHGFALNVSTNLVGFSLINGCGLKDRKTVSMRGLVAFQPSVEQATERLLQHFYEIFEPEP